MDSLPLIRPLRSLPALLAGAMMVALAARLSVPIPGSPVPQSLQTLAVVVVGAVLGAGRGGVAMVVYVGMGAVGLPLFADGAAGVARLWGPTSGYLVGFVPGEALAQGVTPFLWGGAVKSVTAAGILVAWGRWGPGWTLVTPGAPQGSEPVEPGTSPV